MPSLKVPTTPGIYIICNSLNGHCYIGSAKNLRDRRYHHFYDLAKERHHAIYLQRAYTSYGADAFSFHILENLPDESQLIEREQHFLDLLKPEYNSVLVAGRPPSAKGKKVAPEVAARRAATRKATVAARKLENPDAYKTGRRAPEVYEKAQETKRAKRALDPSYGIAANRTHTEETRLKISLGNTGKKKSDEHIAKIKASKAGKPASTEGIAKAKETRRLKLIENPDAYKKSTETKALMSQANKGQYVSPEHLANMTEKARIANTGKHKEVSAEHMAIMTEKARIANTGRKRPTQKAE